MFILLLIQYTRYCSFGLFLWTVNSNLNIDNVQILYQTVRLNHFLHNYRSCETNKLPFPGCTGPCHTLTCFLWQGFIVVQLLEGGKRKKTFHMLLVNRPGQTLGEHTTAYSSAEKCIDHIFIDLIIDGLFFFPPQFLFFPQPL